ncbi:hypothetical protein [Lachnoclostridium sp. An169]|uniref:hypothetical protein n=1 Tax=Lachnoclostridium sp. An169 TaxID=1965569 RepID=UPI0013A60700|nr:hypothetical protein [Lachnoclostridium sp. An169]
MILTSFDQEEYEQTIRDESYQEGVDAGGADPAGDGENEGTEKLKSEKNNRVSV